MEYAKFIDNRYYGDDISLSSTEFDRLYFGNEFCDNHLPTETEIRKVHEKAKMPLTLVFPIISQKKMDAAVQAFQCAYELYGQSLEVIVNDFGIFRMLQQQEQNMTYIAGRILSKNKRDPRIEALDVAMLMSEKGLNALSAPVHDHYIGFLDSLGFSRMEVDATCLQYYTGKGKSFGISLWKPWSILAVGRICPHRNNWQTYNVYDACSLECALQPVSYTIRSRNHSSKVTHHGNAVIFESNADIADIYDRLVENSF